MMRRDVSMGSILGKIDFRWFSVLKKKKIQREEEEQRVRENANDVISNELPLDDHLLRAKIKVSRRQNPLSSETDD